MEFLFQTVKRCVVNHLAKNSSVFSTLQYWLVNNPTILNFSWNQGQTLGASPLFLAVSVPSYLSLTFILSHATLPSVGPRTLRFLTAMHNILLLALSFTMATGCALSIVYHAPNGDHIVCYPVNTPPEGPLFFWSHVFYLSKIFEFMDTLLIILSNSIRRLTFLHVYHHATVVVMRYISLHTSQSFFPGVLVINSSVHVIMYFYYFLCALGKRPWWKKIVSSC